MIEGDLKGYFDNVDHDILINICRNNLNIDKTLKGLITQFLKAGYICDGEYKHSIIGMPPIAFDKSIAKEGGTLSPLLSNVYLNSFDVFIENKINEIRNSQTYNLKRKINAISIRNPDYRKVE
jgi:retron-type reverse transcriptase